MWSALVTSLASIFASPLVDAYKAKLAAGNDADKLAADLAKAEIAVRQQQMSNWITALPIMFLQFGAGFYLVKCWVWDAALGLGSTDDLHGYTKEALIVVIGGMVGNRVINTILKR